MVPELASQASVALLEAVRPITRSSVTCNEKVINPHYYHKTYIYMYIKTNFNLFFVAKVPSCTPEI